MFLYALGGLVLLVRFASVNVPTVSAVEHVSPQGLVATALVNLIGPGLLLGALCALLALMLPKDRPDRAPKLSSKTVLVPAALILVGSVVAPFGWLELAVGVAIAALLLTIVKRNDTQRASDWKRQSALSLFAVGALSAALASLAYAFEPPTRLPVATALDKSHKTLAAGYLVAEDPKAIYIAEPGPARNPSTKRIIVAIKRDAAVRVEVSKEEDPRPESSLVCRLLDGAGPCNGSGGKWADAGMP